MALHFSHGNAKLNKGTLIWNLPAGKTCPGALLCKSFVVMTPEGRKIKDTKETQFRCFAASSEVQYDGVFANRAENLREVLHLLRSGNFAQVMHDAIQSSRKRNTKRVRIHESGDFFSAEYLMGWLLVAMQNPDLEFYCYSKSLDLFMGLDLPSNFYLTASYGGKFDHLIDEGFFPRYAKVVDSLEVANSMGLPVDVDESHCFLPGPYALLVHGPQPAGSEVGKHARANRETKKQLLAV